MNINELLKEKGMSKYELSKISRVPYTTISEIATGKADIRNCTGSTLYKLAKALKITMEELLEDSMAHRSSFDTFKGNICHQVMNMGDLEFIIETLETDRIRKLYKRGWYAECLYLLAMVDYLSRENDLPLCNEYNDLRAARLQRMIYPTSVIVMSAASGSEQPKKDSIAGAIPEFLRHNIVEGEIRNVV